MWYILVIRDGKIRGRLAIKFHDESKAQRRADILNHNSDTFVYRPFFWDGNKLPVYQEAA